ncbi:hypothetical protein BDV98DRAFT_571186 [Pterulicium gracile]|uniref:Uncharacterized protein n=1 Tax=Pterulicium gracile TaxID=1884261 RepID=A0A5C3QMH5_9AGAR|nr:hypothetical protein BDV98DRAFT_571186 [Pterula gracilis]
MGDPGPSIFVEPTFFYAVDDGPAVGYSSPPTQAVSETALIFVIPPSLNISDSPHTLLLTSIIPPIRVDYAVVDVGDISLVAKETVFVKYDHTNLVYQGSGWSRSADGNRMESRTAGDQVQFAFCGTSVEWFGDFDRSIPGAVELAFSIDGRTVRRERFPDSSPNSFSSAKTTPNSNESFSSSLTANGRTVTPSPLFSSDTLQPVYFYPESSDDDEEDDVAATTDPRSSCWHTASLSVISSSGSQALSVSSLTYTANFTTFASLPPLPPEFPDPLPSGSLPPGPSTPTLTAEPTATSILAPPSSGPVTITTMGIIIPAVVATLGVAFWGTVFYLSRRRTAARRRQAEMARSHGISPSPGPGMAQVLNGLGSLDSARRGSSGSMKFAEVKPGDHGSVSAMNEKTAFGGGEMFNPQTVPRNTTYTYTPVFPLTGAYVLDHSYASSPSVNIRDFAQSNGAVPPQRAWSKRKPVPTTSLLLATRIATGELGDVLEELDHELHHESSKRNLKSSSPTRNANFYEPAGATENSHDSWLDLATPSPFNANDGSRSEVDSTPTPYRMSTSESYAAYPRSYADRLVELIDAATSGQEEEEEVGRMHEYMYSERRRDSG